MAAAAVAPGGAACGWTAASWAFGLENGLVLGLVPALFLGAATGTFAYLAVDSSPQQSRLRMAVGISVIANLIFLGFLVAAVGSMSQS